MKILMNLINGALIGISSIIPGMSGGSIVPKQVRAMGMTLGELYDIVIADTLKR